MANGTNSYILCTFVNTDWLKKVGKEMPITLDELYDILLAFKKQDANNNGNPDDEISLVAAAAGAYKIRAWILNALGFCTTGANTALQYAADGTSTVKYIPYTPEYKEYLYYMRNLWNDGLLDMDYFTQTDAQVEAKLADDRSGYTLVSAPHAVDPTKEFSWSAAQPLTRKFSSTPIQPKTACIQHHGMLFINADCSDEKAAATLNLCDSFFTVEGFNIMSLGPDYIEGDVMPEMTAEGVQHAAGYGAFFTPETNSVEWKYDTANYSSS